MKSIAERLREGRYNNLEDLMWEAHDRCTDPDTKEVFRRLAELPRAKMVEDMNRLQRGAAIERTYKSIDEV
jgi:hypothetical protein